MGKGLLLNGEITKGSITHHRRLFWVKLDFNLDYMELFFIFYLQMDNIARQME